MDDLLFAWVPWIYNNAIQITEKTSQISLSVFTAVYNELFEHKEFVFYLNTVYPVPKQLFDLSMIDASKIRWSVSQNPTKFKNPAYTLDSWKHLSYLSFIITVNTKVFDLTDWINEVRWSGFIQPTPLEIFIAWCCETRSPYCFDMADAEVEFVTDDGNVVKRGLNEFTRTSVYEDGSTTDSELDRQDTNRIVDIVLSSSGR
jgi:hypothetical protein